MVRPSRTSGKRSAAKTRKASSAKGRNPVKTKRSAPRTVNRLKRSPVSSLRKELKEAREQQAATAEILKVIASSPDDVQPVFKAIAASAKRLMGGHSAAVFRFIDGVTYLKAFTPTKPEADEVLKNEFPMPVSNFPLAQQNVLNGETEQVSDTETGKEFQIRIARARGFRSIMFSPLMHEGTAIGMISISRRAPGRFADHHVQLLRTFADQAVIAIGNAQLFNETKEALARQTATADVLKVIASSPSNLQPVFDAIAERSKALIGAHSTVVVRYVEGMIELAAFTPVSPEADAVLRAMFGVPRPPTAGDPQTEQVLRGKIAWITDVESELLLPMWRDVARARGWRSRLLVPLKDDTGVIGWISITRKEAGAFAEKDVELLQTFADQAVIAIQNVKLLEEVQARTRDLTEALQQQTATADVLKVISRSAFDLQAVLNTLVESAVTLSGGSLGTIFQRRGKLFHLTAQYGYTPEMLAYGRGNPLAPGPGSNVGRTAMTGTVVQIPDVMEDPDYTAHGYQRVGNFRAMLGIPIMRDGKVEGVFSLAKPEPGAFERRHVELVQTFADQAIIAIENARLFEEVQARTRDLQESLQQQTATSEVLQIISSSPSDLAPVFDKMLENATRVCGAEFGSMVLVEGDTFRNAAIYNAPPAFVEARTGRVTQIHPRSSMAAAIRTKQVVQVEDLRNTPAYLERNPPSVQLAELGGARTIVIVPMLREDEVIGVITVYRQEVRRFGDKQIELLTNFARQAVIAIENARLLRELRQRTDDLSESLEQQTATAEVLEVISSSPGELEPVFKKMLENATRVCGANFGTMNVWDGSRFNLVAGHNVPPEFAAMRQIMPINPHPDTPMAAVLRTHKVVHVADLRTNPAYVAGIPNVVAMADIAGARTIVVVPMLKEDELLGVISIFRREVRPFTDKQVALVENFTNQAVIAIENTRLLNELRDRTDELSRSLDDLRTAQDRLVQTEKLASLGQLTAGIAHEIKNPLNFVNNFSALSVELTDELKEVLKQAELAEKIRQEVGELTQMLKSNLEKVVQHGKRADSIVKNMLLHSREGSGEHRPVEINAIIDESLNLAYHGARAEGRDFNITLERDFDPGAGVADVYPQEITRVVLNLIANGFYAATQRAGTAGNGFEPRLKAVTRNLGDRVEVCIRDNGAGIAPDVQEKIFNPFFTTKPAGEGTGLGLSMSHDIVVKQHGGTIEVVTEPGSFTEFIIRLPRVMSTQAEAGGQRK